MIDTQRALDELLNHLAGEPEVAIDCEMDSMYAYSTSLCVVQVGWPDGEALIDGLAPLDRTRLAALFADPDVLKIFHGGENDVGLLADRWGFEISHLFDTMAAAQVLGHDGVGLAAQLDRHFDVHVSKRFQKADWRVRPLPEDQAEYARLDVRYLIPLRDILLEELQALNREREASSEFARIAKASIQEKPFEPDNWARVKGCKDLPPKARGILREVYVARDQLSREADKAPYRVMHDSALLALATHAPSSEQAYNRLRGVNRKLSSAGVKLLLEAVARGKELGEIPIPRVKSGRRRPFNAGDARLTPDQEKLFEALRGWRTQRAQTRGVDVARVATSALLGAIAQASPLDHAALAAVDGMEDWRVEEYGEEILSVVKKRLDKQRDSK
ncbi:MAG: hypothetical protein DHS20C15_10330 [Planctomycetota bacterium]|nr:MAG: hypothetical protein DHS20C15_10330 [Planctomycetota bacterium]